MNTVYFVVVVSFVAGWLCSLLCFYWFFCFCLFFLCSVVWGLLFVCFSCLLCFVFLLRGGADPSGSDGLTRWEMLKA